MIKLVILIKSLSDLDSFEAGWPKFLHLAEQMPGLRREATSHVDHVLFGSPEIIQMHELFFDSMEDARKGLVSQTGKDAGKLLQEITSSQLILFFADHKQDEMKNIRKFRGKVGLS